MKFCPKCRYYLYLNVSKKEDDEEEKLRRICRNCGYEEEDEKGGLILETDLQERTSEGYKIILNEFTKDDPTLPHVNTLKCPNLKCLTNTSGQEKDVIYLKYDSINLKYIYICNVCDTKWRSK
jgi:DNA-directed RNA polymerase subunit M/transcription elongation factor TFIIS